MKKKAICTMLVIMLIITPTYKVYADAGSLTVAGGTIAVGGLSGAALAGLTGPAVVAVFCAMMAVGVNIELTEQSQQAGMTKTQYLQTKIQQYCTEAGKTADVFYKGILSGTTVLKNGSLAFNDSASSQIKQFINWLFSNDMVNTPTQSGTGSNINIGNVTFPVSTVSEFRMSGDTKNVTMTFSEPVAFALAYAGSQGNKVIVAFTKTAGVTCAELRGTTTRTLDLSATRNGYYYLQSRYFPDANLSFVQPADMPNYNVLPASFLDTLDGSFDMSAPVANDGFTGDRDDWNSRSGVFDPTQGWPTVVNPGLVGQIPIPADTDVTVNIREYLDALQKVLDRLQDIAIVGTDESDGLPKDYDIPDTAEADPTIGKQPPPADQGTPATSDDPPNPSTDPTAAAEPLKFDLRNIFPFCIPFDIKDMLSMLSAEPVAPYYEVDWNIPLINQHLEFTVDLAPWNNVALICRRMELLAFVIGLAVVTRNLIRG